MTTVYTYPDAYLAKFCTQARETRAIADVEVMEGSRTFPSAWKERLVITQCYILACLENQADTEDLFTAKLKTYREQLNVLLPQAVAAADEAANLVGGMSLFSVPLERA